RNCLFPFDFAYLVTAATVPQRAVGASPAASGPKSPAAHGSTLLIATIAVLSAAFAVVIPPFQVCDEHAHFVRAYLISRGVWIGSPSPNLPPDVAAVVMRYPEVLEQMYPVRAADIARDARSGTPAGGPALLAGGKGHYWLSHGIVASNVYCPVAYLPASAGIAIGRLLRLPPLALLYAGRLAGVLFFTLACALAFRLAPEYSRLLAAVALLPMTLHQAAGVSADVMTIGLSFVAVACLLWLRQNLAGRRPLILIAVLFAFWAVCKISPWTFAAVLLIPPVSFRARKHWLAYMGAVALAMLLAVGIWQSLSRGNLEAYRLQRLAGGFDLAANSRYLLSHPFAFAGSAAAYSLRHGARYLVQFVGAFGWSRFWMPLWVQPLALLALLVVALAEPASRQFSARERTLLAGVFLIGVAFVHVALFLSDGFDGIQGRYFIPFSLFGLLAIRQNRFVLSTKSLAIIVAAIGAAHGIASLAWIWTRYYA
ncbi:MAG TPA: DUF2142 domain-containing protein, partial [Candidatus Acidoferrales bacterium]|nr:DUF2142 domain-containing protein [Candidatus Acidoferrales bacterium]